MQVTGFGKAAFAVVAVVGTYAVSSIAYKLIFAPRETAKSITPAVLVRVLTDIVRGWQSALQDMEKQRRELLVSIDPADKETWAHVKPQLYAMTEDRVNKHESQVCMQAGITRQELRDACKRYESDPRVSFLLKMLATHQASRAGAAAASAGPVPLSLEQTLAIMEHVLELSITVMEDVHAELMAEAYPGADLSGPDRPKLTPEIVDKLNPLYSERFSRARGEYYAAVGVPEFIVSRATMAYQGEQEFKQLLAAQNKSKQRRFAALGLAM